MCISGFIIVILIYFFFFAKLSLVPDFLFDSQSILLVLLLGINNLKRPVTFYNMIDTCFN